MARRLQTFVLSLFVCAVCSAKISDVLGDKEKDGFRLFADVMLTHNNNENYSHRAPVVAVYATPSCGFSSYFFLGVRAGALIMPNNYATCVLGPNLRWSFGRRNLLYIDKVPFGFCFPNNLFRDFSFGARVPIAERLSAYISAGYVLYPCYIDRDKYREKYDTTPIFDSWFAPQLKVGFSF